MERYLEVGFAAEEGAEDLVWLLVGALGDELGPLVVDEVVVAIGEGEVFDLE